MIEFVSVTKEVAKKMIDDAPGEMVTVITWNRSTLTHYPTGKKKKTEGKSLIDLARAVSFVDDEIFQTLYLDGELKDPNLLRNILLPKLEPKFKG